MKKILVTFLCVVAAISTHAQFQLANGDFENWETVEYTATKVCEEPVSWSSFYDATGGMKSFGTGTTPQIYKDEDVRPESAGQYSCRITSREVFSGIVAQGNLTSGCVNMGSASATDASGNYNYINEAREDQAMRFSGRPDAVRFWVRFSGVKTGNCSVLLTTKGYYQDPVYQGRNTATLVGQALSGTSIVSNDEWTQYTVPFEWLSDEQPYYALVNISTCSEPGAGAAADYLYIDDMEMIYNSEATAIIYGGENIMGLELVSENFDPAKMGKVVTNGRGARKSWKFESSTNTLTVTIEGDNVSEDPANVHIYQIAFTGGEDAEGTGDEDPIIVVAPQPVELVKGNSYYVFNKATGYFLQDNNAFGLEAKTEWTVHEDNTMESANGKSVSIVIEPDARALFHYGSDKPKSVTVTTTGSATMELTIGGDVNGYTFSTSATWKYGVVGTETAHYTAYMTGNCAELTQADNGATDASKWQLYDVNEYKLYAARKALADELMRAEQIGIDITAGREAVEQSESVDELQSLLNQLRLDEASYVAGKYTEDHTSLLGSVDLSDKSKWTTNLVANKGQHWSDDPERPYYEQTSEQWGQTSWSVSAEQTVELPAGQYLLKAAGRSGVFAQAKMSVDGVEVAFPAKDDYGYGIDVEGNVNFSNNGVYCNGGAGRGWEYRYIAIDLKQKGNVTVKIEASTKNAIHQWFSVADIELLSVPTPVLEMVSFEYDGVSYTPDEEGKIDLSEIYYKETKECKVVTKGYGVVTTSFDRETAVYSITISPEESEYDYELQPKVYQVQFHEVPAPLVFTEPLLVEMGGTAIPSGDVTVYLAKSGDEIYDFELPNFVMDFGGFPMPVGTVRLTDIEMTEREGVQCFTKEQTIEITPGTDEQFNPEDWIGPMLGEVQIVLDEGYVYDGHIFVHLLIIEKDSMPIEVTVGDKNNIPESVTGIGEVKSDNNAEGQKDGKYLINGRVVVVKNGQRFSLSGQRL